MNNFDEKWFFGISTRLIKQIDSINDKYAIFIIADLSKVPTTEKNIITGCFHGFFIDNYYHMRLLDFHKNDVLFMNEHQAKFEGEKFINNFLQKLSYYCGSKYNKSFNYLHQINDKKPNIIKIIS